LRTFLGLDRSPRFIQPILGASTQATLGAADHRTHFVFIENRHRLHEGRGGVKLEDLPGFEAKPFAPLIRISALRFMESFCVVARTIPVVRTLFRATSPPMQNPG
jgi:hypothetical protein